MKPVTQGPLRALVAEQIRSAIESGSLSPEQNLKEQELAAELGVSRTPTREALILLESEGYVVSLPGCGFRVTPISIIDGTHFEQLVAVLERSALEASSPESARDLAALQKLSRSFKSAKGARRRQELDDRFHDQLVGRCPNVRTLQYLSEIKGHLRRHNRVYLIGLENHKRSADEHEKLINALASADRARAGDLLEAHWLGGIARLHRPLSHDQPGVSKA